MTKSARHRPIGIGAVVGLLLLVLVSCTSSDSPESDPRPGKPSATTGATRAGNPLRDGTHEAPAPKKVAVAGSWAAAVPGSDAYLALVSDGSQVMAYFCDSKNVSAWFGADLTSTEVRAVNPKGAVLTATLGASPAEEVSGTVALPGGEATDFTLPAVEKALYRAEQTLDDDAGSALGGWIVLPDGTQRGAITLTISPKTEATVAATTTTAPRQSSTISLVSAPTLNTSTSTLEPQPIEGLTAAPLTPNPITAISLQAGVPNRAKEFVMVTLGDSYAAGEGAPNVGGDFNSGGTLVSGGTKETWSQKPVGHPDVEACHRSDLAAGPQVAKDLQTDFPGLKVIHQSFACSGAQIKNLIATSYDGADKDVTRSVPAQIPQIKAWFAKAAPVSFPGTENKIDALYMNIGGNDFGFAKVIASCISPTGDPCDQDAEVATLISQTDAVIDDRYIDLNTRLRNLVVGIAAVPVRQIYLSQTPNPMRSDTGVLCSGPSPSMAKEGGAANLSNISFAEATWVETNVVAVLNRAIARQSSLFTIVDTIPTASRSHGICAAEPWINNIAAALLSQGKDARLEDLTPGFLSFVGALNLSSGMVHPNAAGYRGMANEIAKKIRPQLVTAFRPPTPGRFRIGKATKNGDIELRWDDNSNVDDRIEIEENSLESGQLVKYPNLKLAANTQSVVIDLLGGPYTAQYRIRACGPKAGEDLCSPWSAPLGASNVVPAGPSNVGYTFSQGLPRRITASYIDNSGFLKIGGPASIVMVARDPEEGVFQFIVQGPGSTVRSAVPATGGLTTPGLWQISLKACNPVGCTDEVGSRTLTVVL